MGWRCSAATRRRCGAGCGGCCCAAAAAGGVSAAAGVHGRRGGLVHLAVRVLQLLPHHGAVLQVVAGIEPQGRVLHRVPLCPGIRRQDSRQDAGAGAVGQVRHQERGPPAGGRGARRQLPPLRLPRDPPALRPRGVPGHPFRPRAAPGRTPPRQAVALHQLPQPDRAGQAHGGDHDRPASSATSRTSRSTRVWPPARAAIRSPRRNTIWAGASSSPTNWPTRRASIAPIATPT